MKFAVIEYNSKTGTVWRHRDDRPNYVADPVLEIDPTSFGCYVSAMRGVHIPLRGLITGPVNQVTPLRRLARRAIKRLSGSWPHNYDISYLKSFSALLVVHQISDGHEITAFAQRLKRELPHICLIGVPTQPFGILQDYWRTHPVWLVDFQEFMATCDVLISIVKSALPTWERLSRHPVEYLPQPYPAAYATAFFAPRTQKEKVLYVAGVPSRPTITRGYVVAQKLQQQFPEYLIRLTQTPDDPFPLEQLQGARYQLVPFEQWREHLQTQRTVSLVINTDYTQTRGRVQVDCAAVGTPSIGANSDGQAELFPELAATSETTVTELVEQGAKLLRDPDYYAHITETARERLLTYDYEPSRQRLLTLIERYRPKL